MTLREQAHDLLQRNRRTTEAGLTYTVPSPETYPYQWLWDSCFHAIMLAKFEPKAAIGELRSLLSRQFSDGLVPHMIFWDTKLTRPYNLGWGKGGTSSITQPPMIAYAAREIFRHSGNSDFLNELFPPILNFYKYLIEKRDPLDHHLISIINPDESGEDNCPRFDKPMHLSSDVSFFGHMYERHKLVRANETCDFEPEVCMKKNFWVKDVPYNTILIKNLEILSELAGIVHDVEAQHFATLNAALIRDAMREAMFSDGVYWAAEGEYHDQLKVATWAHFVPLFAGLYSKKEADDLINTHFHNHDTFHSPFGIRTVSQQEPAYRAAGFWRGPIWFAPHWFIFHGLKAYGFETEATWLTKVSEKLVEKNGFREYFNPETGKAYGAHNFTWGTLVVDMMETL